jgi:hypothetical protein
MQVKISFTLWEKTDAEGIWEYGNKDNILA